MAERIAIVGSRNFVNLYKIHQYVERLPVGTVVISGGARGVDRAAVVAAKLKGLATVVHEADWDGLGKRAGFIRNQLIVDDCDVLAAFWDGQSKGTKHSIDLATKAGKLVEIYYE